MTKKNIVNPKSKNENQEYQNTNSNNTNQEFDVRKKKFWKFWSVMVLLTVGMLVVVGRLLYIQIINSAEYSELAKKQQQSKREITPQRGNIYDRNGNLLASTIKSFSISVDPTVLKNKDSLATLIEKNIGTNKEVTLNKINSANGQYVRLHRRVTPQKITEIRKLRDSLKVNNRIVRDRGIILRNDPTRYYNYSTVAAQILGGINLDDNRGSGGVELQYDSLLRGIPGFEFVYLDANQQPRPALNLPVIESENGANIHLTIDIELQKIVEFELMQGVLNSRATSGTIIALNPNTGEILACASYPSFNPNLRTTFSSENMRIRSVADAYEPGSTFKAITAAAGIEENIVKPTDLFNGFNGAFVQSTYTIKDEIPMGVVDFQAAFESSSNIILSQLAVKIPDNKFYKYIRDFGFGIRTGVDIPGEISGRTPRFDVINQVDKRFLGFGYGIMATPIQLVAAYSAIANEGKLMRPYLVKKIERENKILRETKPQLVRKVISERTSKTLTDLLVAAVENGTGKRAYIRDIKIAGKTGTAQMLISGAYSSSNHLASFIGFYPAENPQICMLVLLDRPRVDFYGGSVAAPIFRNIALRWISISPEFLNTSKGLNISNEAKTVNRNIVFVPELKGLSIDDADMILRYLGLKSKSNERTGIIISQVPSAGTKVNRKTEIMLQVNSSTVENSKPDVRGLSLRRAISILHSSGFRTTVRGSGTVREQKWETDSNKEYICVLICR